MQRVLGKKQRITNQQWTDCMEHIEEYISRSELDDIVEKTVDSIRKTVQGKKAAYAWSGGKDSIVLSKLCEMAGIRQGMATVCDLEYPAFDTWIRENVPEGVDIINTGQDMTWLVKHPQMLFPQESSTAAKWFHMVQHRGQDRYYKEHDLDMMVLGRRRADGNYVGKGADSYTTAKGITRYSPLASWGHEEILAFIHYNDIELPPIYGWQNGYLCGTHPWPARQWTGSEENGWKEVYDIDLSIVEKAAEYFPKALEYLQKMR